MLRLMLDIFVIVFTISLRSVSLLHGLEWIVLLRDRDAIGGRAQNPHQLLLHFLLLRLLLKFLCLSVDVIERGPGHGGPAISPRRLSLLLDYPLYLFHLFTITWL